MVSTLFGGGVVGGDAGGGGGGFIVVGVAGFEVLMRVMIVDG